MPTAVASSPIQERKFFGSGLSVEIFQRFSLLFPNFSSLEELLPSVIAEIDNRISAVLNLILHHPDFQKLEGTWRALHRLVTVSPASADVKIRVLNIRKQELYRSLKKYPGTTWDQGPLFKLIYESEFGTAGGEPFGCLIGDYYFDETPVSLDIMKGIARIAAAAHVPFIAGASPAILNMESWKELSNPRDFGRIFSSPEYIAWRSFRENPDSRYLTLTLPRMLARLPYNSGMSPVNGLDFSEDIGAGMHRNYCWMNAAFALGANVIRAYSSYGWCARICGYETGGKVSLIPEGGMAALEEQFFPPLLETAIPDQLDIELAQRGFSALCLIKNGTAGVFQNGQTVYLPQVYDSYSATKNEEFAAKLPCIFAVSRFAHYIKCILRDKIGTFRGPGEIEDFLNSWLAGYTVGDPDASDEIKAKYPLAEARVQVVRRVDRPGQFDVEIFLRPHYQLEGLKTYIKLTAQIPLRGKV